MARPSMTARRAHPAWRLLAAAVILVAGAVRPAAAQRAEPVDEYAVKAAFLYNFAKFVEWPPEAFADPTAPVVIGVLGEDPFGTVLDETTSGERAHGREIVIRRLNLDSDLSSVHLLFISASERRRLPDLLRQLDGQRVLTVADMDNFAAAGGIIQLVNQDRRIRFSINVRAAGRANLKISSKLLSLATVVGGVFEPFAP